MSDRGLLLDVADAVALRQEVDWERCAGRAEPAQRRALDHLRTFAGICRVSAPHTGASDETAGRDREGARLARRLVGALVAVGLFQSMIGLATGVALLPAATEGMLAALKGDAATAASARGFLPVSDMTPSARFFRIVPHVLYPACGLVLFVGGRFDRRARLLGATVSLTPGIVVSRSAASRKGPRTSSACCSTCCTAAVSASTCVRCSLSRKR